MSGLSRRIQVELAHSIRSGAWAPGRRLPTEQALAATYGCARMTVSQALAALAREGLVERRRRAGTFVARPRVHTAVLEIPDIATLIRTRGETYAFAEVSRQARRASADSDEALLGGGGEVLEVDGVHFGDGRPFALEHRLVRLAAAPGVREADFATAGPGGWLLSHTAWSDARHRVSARAADPIDARRLDVAQGAPCLQLERWTWRLGEGVTFARQRFPADRFDLVADFVPPASA